MADEVEINEPRLWQKNGWIAKVIKNEDDDGWAVEIRKAGVPEPALVSPWVMGRDKKNPKPFDGAAFTTLVSCCSYAANVRSFGTLYGVASGRGSRALSRNLCPAL